MMDRRRRRRRKRRRRNSIRWRRRWRGKIWLQLVSGFSN